MIRVTAEAEGGILKAAITNAQGMTILPAGVELTAPLISALLQQGIESVDIVSAEISAETEKKIEHIQTSFTPFNGVHMMELKTCLVDYLTLV